MNIRLSILIPAYDYPEGVERILSSLCGEISDALEIIISDDSRGDQVSQLVANFSTNFYGRIRYFKNDPGLGAIANWNFLLDQASGEYVLLLHHDEYLLGKSFTTRAMEILSTSSLIDVFVMRCILSSELGSNFSPHLPSIITKFVLKYIPSYLFRRNVIGSPSCVIARRSLYPKFDDRLRWLVDVDAYFRLRQATKKWYICRTLKVGSTLGRKDSITAGLSETLKVVDAQERIYLYHKHPKVRVWLDTKSYRFLMAIEVIVWSSMRLITRLYYRIAYIFRVTRF